MFFIIAPREMALSMLDHGRRSRNHGRPGFAKFEELDQAVAEVDRQLPNLEAWLKLPRMEPWFYDDFAWDHPAAVARILKQCRLSGDPAAIAVITRNAVRAEWCIAAPVAFFQPLTGYLLMVELGYSLSSAWFLMVAALYVIAGICWDDPEIFAALGALFGLTGVGVFAPLL